MRKLAALLLLVLLQMVNARAFAQSAMDSLLLMVDVMYVENPSESRRLVAEMEQRAQSSSDTTELVLTLRAKAKSCAAFALDQECMEFIDSAAKLAQTAHLQVVEIETQLDKLQFCLDDNNLDLANITAASIDKLLKTTDLRNFEVRKLLIFGRYYKQKSMPGEARRYKEQALQLAQSLQNDTLIAECSQALGTLDWFFGDYRQALVHSKLALDLWKKLRLNNGIVNVLKNIGLAQRGLGQIDQAEQSFSQALNLATEMQDRAQQAAVFNLMGGLKMANNKLDQALENFEEGYTIFESLKMLKSGVATLQNIARTYAKKQALNTALQYLNDALRIQEQLADPISESSILNEIGNLYLQKNDVTEALKHYLMALKIRKNCCSNELIAKSLVNIGISYRKIGMLGNAARYLEQVAELAEDKQLKPDEAAYALQNLAHVYSEQHRYDTAIVTYKRALDMIERTGDELQLCRVLCNVAQTQIKNNQFHDARQALTRALKIAMNRESGIDIANIYNELGNVERGEKNFVKALVFYGKGVEQYADLHNDSGRGLCLRKMGEVQLELGNHNEAQQNIEASIKIARQTDNQPLLQYGYLAQYKLFTRLGDYKQALHNYIRYADIRDSLQNLRRNEKSIEAQINLELDQKITEIKLMEAEMEVLRNKTELAKEKLAHQTTLRNFMVAFIVLFAVIVALLVVAFFQKRAHARALEEKIVEINLVNNKLIRSEKELKATIQSKDKLFSIVAHDLRSPFSALLGLTEVMAKQSIEISPDEMAEFSGLVHQSAQNVMALIENLLHWSRTQTGRLVLKPQQLNLLEVLQKVVPTAKLAAQAKNINLNVDINPKLRIFADEETITTVLRNLMSNAIKFTQNGGWVKVEARLVNRCVQVLVQDNGVGIPNENLKKLFNIDGITTKGTNNEGGTGLGLVLCREFVERNDGTIEVKSVEGQGTTFIVNLKTD